MEKLNETIDSKLHSCIMYILEAKTRFVEHYGYDEVDELIDALSTNGFEEKECETLLNEEGQAIKARLNKIKVKAMALDFDKISANDANDFINAVDELHREFDYTTMVLIDDDEAREGEWTTYGADIIQANEVIPEYYQNINEYVDKIENSLGYLLNKDAVMNKLNLQ